MAVLVTGAAGFIGSATSRALLERGDEVVGIDNLNDLLRSQAQAGAARQPRTPVRQPFPFRAGRLRRRGGAEARDRRDSIFGGIVHLGAQAGVRYSLENPQAYIQSNLVGHANMLEVARARRPRHMVYASSSSVYGGNKSLPFRVEDRVDHPLSLYAATKKADELLSESICQPVSAAADGPALLHGLWALGPARHGDVDLHQGASSPASPCPCSTAARCGAISPISTISSAACSPASTSPPADDGSTKAGGSTARTRSTISATAAAKI